MVGRFASSGHPAASILVAIIAAFIAMPSFGQELGGREVVQGRMNAPKAPDLRSEAYRKLSREHGLPDVLPQLPQSEARSPEKAVELFNRMRLHRTDETPPESLTLKKPSRESPSSLRRLPRSEKQAGVPTAVIPPSERPDWDNAIDAVLLGIPRAVRSVARAGAEDRLQSARNRRRALPRQPADDAPHAGGRAGGPR